MADAEFLAKAERVEVQARTKSAISTLKKLLRLGNLQEGGPEARGGLRCARTAHHRGSQAGWCGWSGV